MFVPTTTRSKGCTQAVNNISYLSCGVSLIDGSRWGLPERQVVLTAAHCLDETVVPSAPYPIYVTFDRDPHMVIDTTCDRQRFPVAFGDSSNTFFTSNHKWTSFPGPFGTGYGVGMDKSDHALILLDQKVSASIVPVLANIPSYTDARSASLSNRNMPTVGFVGYGTVTWGQLNNKFLLGKPENIIGSRIAQYGTEAVASVQNWNVNTRMVLTQGDQTLCNGDSGSGMIDVSVSNNTIRGTVQYGDAQCRATNTWNRKDTSEFDTWVRSIVPSICTYAQC